MFCSSNNVYDHFEYRYVPSNYVKKGKKSIFEKILPRKLPFSLSGASCTSASSSSTANNQHRPLLLNTTPKSIDASSSSHQQQHKNVIKYNANESFNTSTTTADTATMHSCRAIVKHKYTASKPDEITLNVGVRVNVLQKFGDGWWRVSVAGNESEAAAAGLYPSNYLLEEVTTDSSLNSSFSSQKSPQPAAFNITSPFSRKHESVSSTERDIEYVRVMYAFEANEPDKLSIGVSDVLKLIDDEQQEQQDDDSRAWLKVMNSQGVVGHIPSKCVQPIILSDEQLKEFVFIRRPTCVGLFAGMPWYFGNVSRVESNALLNKFAVNGDFLVRDSEREVF